MSKTSIPGDSAVVVDRVDKTFKAGELDEVRALSGIDLTVTPGEFVSLIGPSGCGKSTLLRLIGDLLEPTSGAVSLFSKSAHQARLDQDYGMVFQHPGLFDWRNVKANIELPLELHDWSKTDRVARSTAMLELVRLEEFESAYPRQLSGGMQQRVSIARAFVNRPLILLADEPTGNLDPATSVGIMRLLDRINRSGTTVVMATHDRGIVDTMRRRVIELDRGVVVRDEERGVYE